ncbi:MAG: hypothetical protein P8182_08310 [Deltaproteobacteria bacterium]
MTRSDDENYSDDLDKSFRLLVTDPASEAAHEQMKARDREWKQRDPEGFKKDMEHMCREMFGDDWKKEYDAMLREEFPEEFSSPD